MSQGDIEKATGLLRCYTSRVEHGFTVPSLGAIERYAKGLDVPLYKIFYDMEMPLTKRLNPRAKIEKLAATSGKRGKEHQFLSKVWTLLESLNESDRQLWLAIADRLSGTEH
jgi:transcriptional regulator with XRE-family HTH domain